MAKTKKPLHPNQARTLFKPGNPGGGRPVNPLRQALRKFTIREYRRAIELAVQGDVEKLERISESRKHSALRVGVARCLLKAVRNGDWATFELIASRIVGKIPEHLVVGEDPDKPLGSKAIDAAALSQAVADAVKKLKNDF